MSVAQLVMVLLFSSLDGNQSTLPPCPEETRVAWTNCRGYRIYPSGSTYEGGFRNDQFDGQGKYIWPTGEQFLGQFSNGVARGQGQLLAANGQLIVQGFWENDDYVVNGGVRWYKVGVGENSAFFVAPESIRIDGASRRAWVTVSFFTPMAVYNVISFKRLDVYDCNDERVKTLSLTPYSGPFGSGRPLPTVGERQWDFVIAGTIAHATMTYVCTYRVP